MHGNLFAKVNLNDVKRVGHFDFGSPLQEIDSKGCRWLSDVLHVCAGSSGRTFQTSLNSAKIRFEQGRSSLPSRPSHMRDINLLLGQGELWCLENTVHAFK